MYGVAYDFFFFFETVYLWTNLFTRDDENRNKHFSFSPPPVAL